MDELSEGLERLRQDGIAIAGEYTRKELDKFVTPSMRIHKMKLARKKNFWPTEDQVFLAMKEALADKKGTLPMGHDGTIPRGNKITIDLKSPGITPKMAEFLKQPSVFTSVTVLKQADKPDKPKFIKYIPSYMTRDPDVIDRQKTIHTKVCRVLMKDGKNKADLSKGITTIPSGPEDLEEWWEVWSEHKEDILLLVADVSPCDEATRLRAMQFLSYLFGSRPIGSTIMLWSNLVVPADPKSFKPEHREKRRREERYFIQHYAPHLFVRAMEHAMCARWHPDFADPGWLVRVMEGNVRWEGPIRSGIHRLIGLSTTIRMFAVLFIDPPPRTSARFDYTAIMLTFVNYLTHLFPAAETGVHYRRLTPEKPLRKRMTRSRFTESNSKPTCVPQNHHLYLHVAVDAVALLCEFLSQERYYKADDASVKEKRQEFERNLAEFLDRHLVWGAWNLSPEELTYLRALPGDLAPGDLRARYSFAHLTRLMIRLTLMLDDSDDFDVDRYPHLAIFYATYRINDCIMQKMTLSGKGKTLKIKKKDVLLSKNKEKGRSFGKQCRSEHRGQLDLLRTERICRVCDKLCLGQKQKLMTCGGCHCAAYCSKACQKADWKSGTHKKECETIRDCDARLKSELEAMEPVCLIARGQVHINMKVHFDKTGAMRRYADDTRRANQRDVQRELGLNPGVSLAGRGAMAGLSIGMQELMHTRTESGQGRGRRRRKKGKRRFPKKG